MIAFHKYANDALDLYHGTNHKMADEYLRGNRKVDPSGFVKDVAHRYGLNENDIESHQLFRDGWWGSRMDKNDFDYIYLTTDRAIAEGYAQAGTAPLYDLLKIAFHRLHPENLKKDLFGSTLEGFDEWVKDEVVTIGGGPVLLKFSVGLEEVKRSLTYLERCRIHGRSLSWEEFTKWQLGRGDINDREIAFLRNDSDLWECYKGMTPLSMPSRIITRNGVRQ